MISELFVENKKAPLQTKIYISKSYYYWQIALAIFWIAVGVYFLFAVHWIIGVVVILYMLLTMRGIPGYLKLVKENSIQIELSDKGIALEGRKAISWGAISKDQIINEANHASPWNPNEYLTFTARSKEFKIFLNHLDTNSSRLEYLLKIYRKRSEKKKNESSNIS